MQITANHKSERQRWMLVTWLLLISVIVWVMVQSSGVTPKAQQVVSVSAWVEPEQPVAIDSVIASDFSDWEVQPSPVNLGMSQSAHWLRVELYRHGESSKNTLFEINYPLLDKAKVWFFTDKTSQTPLKSFEFGDSVPFSKRAFLFETFVFDLSEFEFLPKYAVVRVESQGSLRIPMRLWQTKDFIEYTSTKRIAMGIFFGLLVAMGISNFFFYLTTRSPSFIVYTGYVLSVTLVLATLLGYSFEYLWPDNIWLQQHAIAIFANAAIMFAVLFTKLVLKLADYSPRLSRITSALAALFFINIGVSLFVPYYYLIQIFLVLLLLVVAVVFGLCIWLSLKNISIARYYTLAWFVLLLSAFTAALDNLHVIALPISSSTLLLYGVTAETLLLALVLAISYGTQQEDLEAAQALALNREKEMAEAKDQLLEVEQQAKDDLEYKVQERTLELEITLRELSEANQELERLNTIDALTGIRNRRHFDKRIVAEGRRSRREQTTLCLVMLDVDHFKRINDDYGHDVGDECLKHIAKLAKSFIKRPSDDICRYGGEEFAFILPNTSEEGAEQFIDGVRAAIEATPCETESHTVAMTISAGIASAVVLQENDELKILKAADQALYQAKQNGRNRVIVANHSES